MAYKAQVQEFTTAWNKASAWAASQGIPSSSYLPVYKLDLSRVQQGWYPMSSAERNRAILAAHTPKQVTPAPTTTPSDLWTPSGVWHNSLRDASNIFTGLIHLPTGLYDVTKNTFLDIADPSRLKGKTTGATIGNILDTTLASFIPGAADLGRFLQAGGGMAGLDKLMEDPLLSALDVLPADIGGGVLSKLATTDLGAQLAERAGMSTDELSESGLLKTMRKVVSNTPTSKVGVAAGGGAVKQMTVGDVLHSWTQSKIGISKPIADMMQGWSSITLKGTAVEQSLMAPAFDAVMSLTSEERDEFDRLLDATQQGTPINQVLDDKSIDPKVAQALRTTWDGPRRFAVEEEIAYNDVSVVRDANGEELVYSANDHPDVLKARKTKQKAQRAFVNTLDPMDHLVAAADKIEQARPGLVDRLTNVNQAARTATDADESLLENTTFEVPANRAGRRKVIGLPKKDQAAKVFGEGGLVDQAVEMLRAGQDDQLGPMVEVLKRRLSSWGAHSVTAAANPAFEAVRDAVGDLDTFVKTQHKVSDEIDKRIYGTKADVSRATEASKDFRQRERGNLKSNHRRQIQAIADQKSREIGAAQARATSRIDMLGVTYRETQALIRRRLENFGQRADPKAMALAKSQVTKDLADLRRQWQASVKQVKEELRNSQLRIRDDARTVERKARAAQAKEIRQLSEAHANLADYHGELMREMNGYAKALDRFNKTVWDHPPDAYRTMYLALYYKHLKAHENSAELIDATEKSLKERSGFDQTRLEALRENPRVLAEMVYLFARDVYHDPTASPDLMALTQQVNKDVTDSAMTELQTLRAQGFRPPYMPSASSLDVRDDVMHYGTRILVGHGTPSVDAAKARAFDLTAKRHDVMLGVSKSLKQVLDRDNTIEFVEHYLAPLTTTGRQLEEAVRQYNPVETLNASRGTLPDFYAAQARSMGLEAFDPKATFGFTRPSWGADKLYLPASLTKSLNLLVNKEQFPFTGLYDKATGLFRYSILNLSPRYTAHVTFGGTALLALKSTPYVFKYIGAAWKGVKDGSLPLELDRMPTTVGYAAHAFQEHALASGKQMGWLAIQEHIEERQGVRWAAAKAVHVAKALGDINMRFTRHVVHMQGAVAFLDGMARAERRGKFLDPETGQLVEMTKERALVEGMHHVDEVMGNLGRMSPVERTLARKVMPFYGWTKHILRYVLMFPVDHPWRAQILSQIAFNASADVSPALYTRMQFLFFLGSPSKTGAVSAITDRFMDPLRDVASYGTLSGWLGALNPAIMLPIVQVFGPQAVYGSSALYPSLTYNSMYGIETAGSQGNLVSGLEQFIPQTGALATAIDAASATRSLAKSNPNEFAKQLFESLNIPFAQVQNVNVKQIAAQDETRRYEVAKQAATTAWQSGNFGKIAAYKNVPDPRNPDYEITPEQLEAIYNASLAQQPNIPPSEIVASLPNPSGYG